MKLGKIKIIMEIVFRRSSLLDEYYDILYKNKVIGEFRIYRNIDFICSGVKLEDFLGYVKIDREYRNKGILKRIIREFGIKSLMVDDIEDVSVDVLKLIYERLGFRIIEGSDRFMIKKE